MRSLQNQSTVRDSAETRPQDNAGFQMGLDKQSKFLKGANYRLPSKAERRLLQEEIADFLSIPYLVLGEGFFCRLYSIGRKPRVQVL